MWPTPTVFDADIIRTLDNPILAEGGLVVLKGTLAPRRRGDQAVGRHAGADEASRPRRHLRGPRRPRRRIDDPDLDITESDVIVLKGAGPGRRAGHAGMGRAADPEEAAASREFGTCCASPTRA